MRRVARKAFVGLISAAMILGTAGPATADTGSVPPSARVHVGPALDGGFRSIDEAVRRRGTSAPFRSVAITLINRTGCDLNRIDMSIAHGIWTSRPPELVEPDGTGRWATESNGILTGTEAAVTFRTSDCDRRDNRRKNVRLHWSSPFIGSANYRGSADSPVQVNYNGTPSANASVTYTASAA